MRYLIDSSIWFKYLEGTKEGEKLRAILKEENEIFTISLILSEVISKVKRARGNAETAYECIIKNSKLFDITPRVAKEAGLLHALKKNEKNGFPMSDSIIICCANALNAKVITADNHFKSFKNVIFLNN